MRRVTQFCQFAYKMLFFTIGYYCFIVLYILSLERTPKSDVLKRVGIGADFHFTLPSLGVAVRTVATAHFPWGNSPIILLYVNNYIKLLET